MDALLQRMFEADLNLDDLDADNDNVEADSGGSFPNPAFGSP